MGSAQSTRNKQIRIQNTMYKARTQANALKPTQIAEILNTDRKEDDIDAIYDYIIPYNDNQINKKIIYRKR